MPRGQGFYAGQSGHGKSRRGQDTNGSADLRRHGRRSCRPGTGGGGVRGPHRTRGCRREAVDGCATREPRALGLQRRSGLLDHRVATGRGSGLRCQWGRGGGGGGHRTAAHPGVARARRGARDLRCSGRDTGLPRGPGPGLGRSTCHSGKHSSSAPGIREGRGRGHAGVSGQIASRSRGTGHVQSLWPPPPQRRQCQRRGLRYGGQSRMIDGDDEGC